MNTQDARREMESLAAEALAIVSRIREGRAPSLDDRNNLRRMASEARALLAEAGYPGEAVWRGLQRSSMGTDTNFDSHDSGYWQDVVDELERGAATLASLDSSRSFRDVDFHIVG
jgi:hypothetical protein